MMQPGRASSRGRSSTSGAGTSGRCFAPPPTISSMIVTGAINAAPQDPAHASRRSSLAAAFEFVTSPRCSSREASRPRWGRGHSEDSAATRSVSTVAATPSSASVAVDSSDGGGSPEGERKKKVRLQNPARAAQVGVLQVEVPSAQAEDVSVDVVANEVNTPEHTDGEEGD